jgi:phosphoglycerol transferase
MRSPSTRVREWLSYAAAAAVSIYAAVFLLKLWQADLRVPIDYGGDALFNGMLVKSVVDHGRYLHNPSLGAPGGLDLNDFPIFDNLHLFIIKLMSLASHDWALLFNVYFLLGFPLITLSAMAVLRRLGVGTGPAIVVSVLYAFLPSRLIKGEGHLFLDVYFQVPLALLVVLWVCGADPPLTRDRGPGRLPSLELGRGRSWFALAVSVAGASLSVYYSFFTACLLLVGGAWASLTRRTLRNLLAGVVLTGAIVAGLVANSLPTVIYQARHGPNPAVGQRHSGEAEIYGMKIAQLLLPMSGHRVAALRRLRQQYDDRAPLGGENGTTSLGVVGGVGFLALLGLLLGGPRPARPGEDLLRPLVVLNLAAVLIATIGGFGSLIATLVTPQIRTYSRMNVFIEFFALAAVALLLDRLAGRRPRLARIVVPVVLAVGLLDQTSPRMIRAYAATKRAYASDGELVRRIEAAVPSGTMVFELPYVSFPESGPVNDVGGYDQLRPYLQARSLRWSFPTMRGRAGDVWAADVAKLEPSQMIATLTSAGFGGLLVDRSGYADQGAALEAALTAALGVDPMVSVDRRESFFPLRASGGARAALPPWQLAP